ncbi:glycoside hydrolase family 15 protein [Streptomyces sp. ICN988]|uniref:glycoside hydrolase family 15 protein n=1 Tax=Streptomyces sp. ICN988 TaxID=2983765 RepID=UPI0021E37925|nr:glycoside hydrolase family 15 protein [Streptomyces sp. ICN988]MCV2458168.1 glycoside hydrolase family 15 protein [Streptomyces sp. ICN988]
MVLETTYTTQEGTACVTAALGFGALGQLPWTELAHVVTVVLAVVTDHMGEATCDGRTVRGEATLEAGHTGLLALVAVGAAHLHVPRPEEIVSRVDHTITAWRQWTRSLAYDGPWRNTVVRSALTLKALTSRATGAIAGAATTSLPEKIGESRNFDYRFAWIRDGSYALDAMSRLGLSEELHAGVTWLLDAVSHEAPALRPQYALSGAPVPDTMEQVPGVPGYRHSLPVNVGNAAAGQTQLGSYGDLFDAVWHYCQRRGHLDQATGTLLSGMTDRVCDMLLRGHPTPASGNSGSDVITPARRSAAGRRWTGPSAWPTPVS